MKLIEEIILEEFDEQFKGLYFSKEGKEKIIEEVMRRLVKNVVGSFTDEELSALEMEDIANQNRKHHD